MPNEYYSNEIEAGQNAVTQFEAARDALDGAIKDEEQDRIAAVAGLSGNIADLVADIATETADRITAVAGTQSQINTHETRLDAFDDVADHVDAIEDELDDARDGESSIGIQFVYLRNAVATLVGGASASDNLLKQWTAGNAYEMTSITYDVTYPLAIASAVVKWPDGTAGAFTTTQISSTFQAVNAFTITHTTSGKTVTQAAMTRNANGNVTSKPALVVTP